MSIYIKYFLYGKRRGVILKNSTKRTMNVPVSVHPGIKKIEVICGTEVNHEGEYVTGKTPQGYTADRRVHIIQVSEIRTVQYLYMSPRYGELVANL